MIEAPIQESVSTERHIVRGHGPARLLQYLSKPLYQHILLLILTVFLLLGSVVVTSNQAEVYAANPGPGNACYWYRIRGGDTLAHIARWSHSSVWTLARANRLWNINLIFQGQSLCIPHRVGSWNEGRSGLYPNGNVRWYAYDALDWSNYREVSSLLHYEASRYHLPPRLLLAIAWQESGWKQHVIARDGGIGVMQLMPYTARAINTSSGIKHDPYKLRDNITLGARLLHSLWIYFHGNLVRIISAYNEGAWAVVHCGIFNWRYVNNVLYLMRTL